MDLEARIMDIIKAQLDVPSEQLHLDASFTDDLNVGSLEVVELVMALERDFDIAIPEADIERIKTIRDAVATVSARLA